MGAICGREGGGGGDLYIDKNLRFKKASESQGIVNFIYGPKKNKPKVMSDVLIRRLPQHVL